MISREALEAEIAKRNQEISSEAVSTMSSDDIEAEIKRRVQGGETGYDDVLQRQAEETGIIDTFLVSTGKGLYDIARGVGLVDPPSKFEKAALDALSEESPITSTVGEIVGQSLPFLTPATLAGGIASTPLRVGAMAAIGASEGGIISEGTGGNYKENIVSSGVGGVIAGVSEALFPMLGRISRKIYSRINGKAPDGALLTPDGDPTPEMKEALDKAGLKWEQMKVDAQDLIARQKAGASPEETARLAGFEEMGSPALKGQISKDLVDRKLEQGLLESTTEAAAEPVRQTILRQSEAIKSELNNIIGKSGVSGETGSILKEVLTGRRKTLKAERKTLYKKLGDDAQKLDKIPVFSDPILEALPDQGTMRDIAGIVPNQFKAVNDLLIEFGIDKSQDAVEEAAARGIKPDILGLHNFERLRKRLGNIERTDQTGAISNIIIPIRRSLDEEIDTAAEALEGVGGEIAQIAKDARQSHVSLKTEFDEKKITSKLIDSVKRGSTQPKIEASQAYQKIMSPNAPIEDLERVMVSLNKSGAEGKRAIQDMQGRAVLDLLDSAFSAQSRQVSGQRTFGATPFSKQFEKLEPKLEMIFSNDKAGYRKLKNVYNRSQDIIPPNAAVPKGSAGFFIDTLNKIGVSSIATKVPFARELFEIAKGAGQSAEVRKSAERAINAKPNIKNVAHMVDRDYPQLAAALGIAGISTTKQDKEEKEK